MSDQPPPIVALPPVLIGAREAADCLAISERTVRDLYSSGQLRCVRIGTRVLFRPRDLHAFADGLEEGEAER